CTDYNYGAVVQVTPNPSTGWTFAGFQGVDCTGSGPCQVTLTAARSASALFTINTYNLTTSVAPSGAGSINTSPAGRSCGTGCQNYDYDIPVQLTAVASPNYTFSSWSGDCLGQGNPCTLRMT